MSYHTSVLLAEVIENLVTAKDGLYLDGTLGGGGHTSHLLKALEEKGHIIGMDQDKEAIELCQEKFKGESRLTLCKSRFSKMENFVGTRSLDGVVLDLGVSSRQLDSDPRGFSFESHRPLDMRMDAMGDVTALDYLHDVTEEELARVMWQNSDVKSSRRLAVAIKSLLPDYKDTTLIHVALDKVFPKGLANKNRMLAMIFQAIRMEVNEELKEVTQGLDAAVKLVKKGGRICVITFHSVEDRLVKRTFQKWEKSCHCPPRSPLCTCGGNQRKIKKVFKKPLLPSSAEISRNGRSRSAKLRVVEKVAA